MAAAAATAGPVPIHSQPRRRAVRTFQPAAPPPPHLQHRRCFRLGHPLCRSNSNRSPSKPIAHTSRSLRGRHRALPPRRHGSSSRPRRSSSANQAAALIHRPTPRSNQHLLLHLQQLAHGASSLLHATTSATLRPRCLPLLHPLLRNQTTSAFSPSLISPMDTAPAAVVAASRRSSLSYRLSRPVLVTTRMQSGCVRWTEGGSDRCCRGVLVPCALADGGTDEAAPSAEWCA